MLVGCVPRCAADGSIERPGQLCYHPRNIEQRHPLLAFSFAWFWLQLWQLDVDSRAAELCGNYSAANGSKTTYLVSRLRSREQEVRRASDALLTHRLPSHAPHSRGALTLARVRSASGRHRCVPFGDGKRVVRRMRVSLGMSGATCPAERAYFSWADRAFRF